MIQVAAAGDTTLPAPAAALPVPAASVFEVAEGLRVAMLALPSPARQTVVERPVRPALVAVARSGKRSVAGKPVHQTRLAAPSGRNISKRALPDRKNAKRNGRHREARLDPAV